MNAASTAVICGSSLVMAVLGQPAVMTRIAAFMTHNEEILEFRAFTLANLKGGAISLLIGAAVYLTAVRHVLYRGGSYVNLWPEKLDLENAVMRPLLTRILPGFFGSILSVFGENRLLRPAAKGLVFIGTFAGRVLCDSMDALVVLMKKTVVRERRSVSPDIGKVTAFRTVREVTQETVGSVRENFSFAMMMTCLGILIVLMALVLLAVFHIRL